MTEYRRGAEPLDWDAVQVGDALPGTVRGPLTLLDMTCYYAGAVGTSGYKSTKLKTQYRVWATTRSWPHPQQLRSELLRRAVQPFDRPSGCARGGVRPGHAGAVR